MKKEENLKIMIITMEIEDIIFLIQIIIIDKLLKFH